MIDKHNSTAYYFIVETEEIPIKFPQINIRHDLSPINDISVQVIIIPDTNISPNSPIPV